MEEKINQGDQEIEPQKAKQKAYENGKKLVDDEHFYNSRIGIESSIKLIHALVTNQIDWDKMKAAAPDEFSKSLAQESKAFGPAIYRDIIRARIEDGSEYIEPEFIQEAMQCLSKSIEGMLEECLDDPDDITPYVIASWAYLKIVAIHPFIDGNGRTAELLMDLICRKKGKDPIRIDHDSELLEEAFNKCSFNPVEKSLEKPPQEFISEIRDATVQRILDDKEAIEFAVALIDVAIEQNNSP